MCGGAGGGRGADVLREGGDLGLVREHELAVGVGVADVVRGEEVSVGRSGGAGGGAARRAPELGDVGVLRGGGVGVDDSEEVGLADDGAVVGEEGEGGDGGGFCGA